MLYVLREITELPISDIQKEALFARCQQTINKLQKRMASARNQIEQEMDETEIEQNLNKKGTNYESERE